MPLTDHVLILRRPIKTEELHLLSRIILYSEIIDSCGAVKQSETIFFLENPIKCTKEVKIFAPPPRYYTTTPKTSKTKISKKFTKTDVVNIVNKWVSDSSYLHTEQKGKFSQLKKVYLWEAHF